MDADYFAARLKELREQAGLTQQELAERTGFTASGVSQWEMGRRVPAWPHVVALAEALGVTPDAFLAEPQARPPAGRGRPRKAEEPPARPKRRKRKKGE
jgi:transcriptional regulator with XRE-family HTH domain